MSSNSLKKQGLGYGAGFSPSVTVSGPDKWEKGVCRFIAGDPRLGEAVYCGHGAKVGSSFCEDHHALCWKKPKDKND